MATAWRWRAFGQGERVDAWWPCAPRLARATAFACAVALVYGTCRACCTAGCRGNRPYPSMPGWLAAYFVSLTVLDPFAAVLLLRRRRAGLALGCTVLLTDAAAYGHANYVLDATSGLTFGRVGQGVITALALSLTLAATQLWSAPRPHPASR